MPVFWLIAALMTAVALAFVLIPLLRARPASGPSALEANLEVLRGQRRELEADIATGTLPAEAREQALAELVERADADLEAAPAAIGIASPHKPWVAAAVAAVGIPAVAFGLYLVTGAPGATNPAATAAAPPMDEKHVVEMVDKLAAKVREHPDDAKGWSLYARSTAALGRFKESAEAYEHLLAIAPADPQILADYADVLGMTQGRTLAGKPFELAKRALELDPDNRKALALAGTAAMDAARYAEAAAYWERLAAQLPPGSEDETEVRAILTELRGKAASAGTPVAASAPPSKLAAARASAKSAASTTRSPGAKSVSGVITVAPEMASRISSTDTIFVLARAEGGPRAPLAVMRGSAREFPLRFALDDTMAMSPQWSLSSAKDIRIEARVSRSGNAMTQPGDVFGTSVVVKPGAKDVRIVLDKVQP